MFKRPLKSSGRKFKRLRARSNSSESTLVNNSSSIEYRGYDTDDSFSDQSVNFLTIIGKDLIAHILSYLSVRNILKFSEVSRRANTATCHESVWEHVYFLRRNMHVEVSMEHQNDLNGSMKSLVLKNELLYSMRQIKIARARCVPLQLRCNQLSIEQIAIAQARVRLAAELSKHMTKIENIGRDIEIALNMRCWKRFRYIFGLPLTITSWSDLLSLNIRNDEARRILQNPIGGSCMILFNILGETIRDGRNTAMRIDELREPFVEESLKYVNMLREQAEQRHWHHVCVSNALSKWLANCECSSQTNIPKFQS